MPGARTCVRAVGVVHFQDTQPVSTVHSARYSQIEGEDSVAEKESLSNFEAAVKRLEEIVSSLDDQALPLDKALSLFEEGIGVSRTCADLLETAKARVEKLVEKSPGVFSLEAFDKDDDGKDDEVDEDNE